MPTKLMYTTAAIALMAPAVALADTQGAAAAGAEMSVDSGQAIRSTDTKVQQGDETAVTAEEIEDGAQDAYDATAEATEDAYEATADWLDDVAEDIGAAVEDIENELAAAKGPVVERDGYQLMTASAVSARLVMDAPVYDATGKEIGEIEDIVLDADGNAGYYVVSQGGVFGIGEHTASIPYTDGTLVYDREADARLKLDVTEETVAEAKAFDGETLSADAMLVSTLTGTDVAFAEGTGTADADIYDVILTSAGTAEFAVIEYEPEGAGGDKLAAVPFDAVTVAQGDGGYEITGRTRADLDAGPAFVYYEGMGAARTR